jgi:hypothetical protein
MRGLAVITHTPLPALSRYDYYLRQRPWLPDLVQLARADARDVWLNEPAQATLRGLFERLGDMVAELAAGRSNTGSAKPRLRLSLLRQRCGSSGASPRRSSRVSAPATGDFNAAVVSPNEMEFFKLAETLRLRLAGEPEQD